MYGYKTKNKNIIRKSPVTSIDEMLTDSQFLSDPVQDYRPERSHSLFKQVSSHLGVDSTQRVVQEVDVCVLVDGSGNNTEN